MSYIQISILKNRYTGKLGRAKVYFDYNSYRFYGSPFELWKRYGWSKNRTALRVDDPNQHKVAPAIMM